MIALPRVKDAEHWRQRAEMKERARQSAAYERHMQVLAKANELRSELRDERKQRAK